MIDICTHNKGECMNNIKGLEWLEITKEEVEQMWNDLRSTCNEKLEHIDLQ